MALEDPCAWACWAVAKHALKVDFLAPDRLVLMSASQNDLLESARHGCWMKRMERFAVMLERVHWMRGRQREGKKRKREKEREEEEEEEEEEEDEEEGRVDRLTTIFRYIF